MSSAQTKTQRPVNAVQQRLIALNLLERAVKAMTDAEVDGCVAGLNEEQTKLVEQRCGGLGATVVRTALGKGRMMSPRRHIVGVGRCVPRRLRRVAR